MKSGKRGLVLTRKGERLGGRIEVEQAILEGRKRVLKGRKLTRT